MIANPNYQLLVTKNDIVVQANNQSLKAALDDIKGNGKILLVDEDNLTPAPSPGTPIDISKIKRFSLYQYKKNDKGNEILIKHGGPLPIVVSQIREKAYKANQAGVPQYWQLTMDADYEGCCENYAVRFGLYNDAIQKTMFPSELVETYSTENECCGKGCGNNDPYDGANIIFRLWVDIMTRDSYNKNYVTAYIVDSSHKSLADNKGNIKFKYGTSPNEHTVTTEIGNIKNGNVTYNDTDSSTPSITTTYTKSISDFIDLMDLSGNINLVFAIAAEDENTYGQMNFKYDVIRNTVARVTLNGGFECASGISLISNDSTNNSSIYIETAGETATTAVSKFAYSFGSGYDVREMELADSLHTINSPYTLSDITLSENGIHFDSNLNSKYNILSFEYNHPSDGVTRIEHHPWGTTIAIESTAAHTNFDYLKTLIGA